MNTIGLRTAAALAGVVLATDVAAAADLHARMEAATANGPGPALGTITVTDSPAGVVFKVDLKGLPPGSHGFHVHDNGACGVGPVNGTPAPAGAAGGHMDPSHTGKHEGPQGHGHMGDLPALQAGTDGSVMQGVTAPSIKAASLVKGHALVIHAGGDNYSDQPAPLGGGGARIACGVIE